KGAAEAGGSDTSEAKATHPRQGSLFAFRCQSSFLCRRLSRSQGKNIWPCNPWMPVAYLETEPRGALEHPVFYALHHRLGIER
ncbi:MAG: hypothetical protein WCD63_16705, partial [Terrimicrobiaceae bacterium]